MKKIILVILATLMPVTVFCSEGYFLKLTDAQANQMIEFGLNQMFGETTTSFDDYTYYIQDASTGEKYWWVTNIQKKGIYYDIVGWVDINYPSSILLRYDRDYVNQFLPVNNDI